MTRRDGTSYVELGQRAVARPVAGALGAEVPTAGFYRHKLRGGSIPVAVKVWHGAPLDPVTGEELDRGWRWQATADGEPIPLDDVWPECGKRPITEVEYAAAIKRRAWAQKAAPASSYAIPGKRYDPLSRDEPLPF